MTFSADIYDILIFTLVLISDKIAVSNKQETAMKNKLTKELVQAAIDKNTSYVDALMQSDQKDNPQIVKSVTEALGRIDALKCVLDAMNGDASMMKYL